MRFYRLHTPLSYLSATSHEDAQTNFRNGPHGRWKYSLPSATIQAHLSTRINDSFFRLADIRKIFRKGHTHVYTQVHARIRIHFDTSAQCILAITDYSNTERMCIQHQRSSYITITTAIYTDYYRTTGRAKFTGPLEKVRRNGDPSSSSSIIQNNNTFYICIFSRVKHLYYTEKYFQLYFHLLKKKVNRLI